MDFIKELEEQYNGVDAAYEGKLRELQKLVCSENKFDAAEILSDTLIQQIRNDINCLIGVMRNLQLIQLYIKDLKGKKGRTPLKFSGR